MQVGSDVEAEGTVAITPLSHFYSVAEDLGPGHRSVYAEEETFACEVFAGQAEVLPVSGMAPPSQFAGGSRIFLMERVFHAPVVRKVNGGGIAVQTVFIEGYHPVPVRVVDNGPSFVETFSVERLRLDVQAAEQQQCCGQDVCILHIVQWQLAY